MSRLLQPTQATVSKSNDLADTNKETFYKDAGIKKQVNVSKTPATIDGNKSKLPNLDLTGKQLLPPTILSQKTDAGCNGKSSNPVSAEGGNEGDGKFLLVDDNPINLKMLVMFMKKLNLKYSTATNGQEAVDRYREHPTSYKCVFMDISMPVMNGFEATRCIRQVENDCAVPRSNIFALTGLASRDAQQEAMLSGIDLFLTKPIELGEMRYLLGSKGLISTEC